MTSKNEIAGAIRNLQKRLANRKRDSVIRLDGDATGADLSWSHQDRYTIYVSADGIRISCSSWEPYTREWEQNPNSSRKLEDVLEHCPGITLNEVGKYSC